VCFEPILETALFLGTDDGAVLTGALAYGLYCSQDRLFANGARSARAL
jgi:hypothetical protein